MLWRGTRPGCDLLDAELQAAGVTAFGRDAVRLADRHAEDCAVCSEHRRSRLTPAALFSAVPVLAAPAGLRALVAAHTATVPVGTAATGAGAGPGGAGGGASSSGGSGSGGATAHHASSATAHEPAPADVPEALIVARVRRPPVVAALLVVAALVVGGLALVLGRGGDGSSSDAVALRKRTTATTGAAATRVPTTRHVGPGGDRRAAHHHAPRRRTDECTGHDASFGDHHRDDSPPARDRPAQPRAGHRRGRHVDPRRVGAGAHLAGERRRQRPCRRLVRRRRARQPAVGGALHCTVGLGARVPGHQPHAGHVQRAERLLLVRRRGDEPRGHCHVEHGSPPGFHVSPPLR